ncbi:uncharacterized protein N7479_004634 [Penicillium vulpinum]|uniref:Uncharacterized protein n=1 Tax=Penicillium vulpinum TaxID=29845 RepID=A0A1V6RMJ2_9EURO|nr:uncharacterized protein N7479_004634 [Penicillium vulpinum]KAJ5964758.1 hypothetical protein N7479_004634 [Penicillium vulpinum]OQE02846.1 hypothetical protein PENVUL_c038G03512 [Penicillium vulpinum]
MAVHTQPPDFCKHCEVAGHNVVHCHLFFQDLTNFANTVGIETGYTTQSSALMYQTSSIQKPYRVAHWGKGKKASNNASFAANFGVAGQGNGTSLNLGANLNPIEAETLARYLEHYQIHWLWCRELWAYFLMHQQPEGANSGKGEHRDEDGRSGP